MTTDHMTFDSKNNVHLALQVSITVQVMKKITLQETAYVREIKLKFIRRP